MNDSAPPSRRNAPPSPRAATQWLATVHPADTLVSTFASTTFDPDAADVAKPRTSGAGSAFDMCHVGVVLRAVLFVHAVLAIGVLFFAAGFEPWLAQLALVSGVALPAVLLWLVVACVLRDPLARLAVPAQWATVVGLGALCAGFCSTLQAQVGLGLPAGVGALAASDGLAPTLAGAAFAAALFYWLRLRAQAQGPADTSARLAELQSRIRPHFLFNTLNTAITLARVDPERTEKILEDLAELFRVALADTDEAVTLGSEVELAQRYLAIEQIRFGDRLRVKWQLDPGAAAARVPPLLLQPLVENAVRHGIEPAPDGGIIRIRTRLKGDQTLIDIDNTVNGEPSRAGAGMALRNVRERLYLMHDVASQFETRSEGGLFHVHITLPAR